MTDIESRAAAGMAGNASATTSKTPYLVWMGATPWDGIPGTDRRMAAEMARYTRVLWVDPQSSVVTSARRHGTIRGGLRPVLSEVSAQITHLSPVALPGLTRPGIRGTTAPMLRAQVRWALRRLNASPSAVVAGYLTDVLGRWEGAVSVLYCTDGWVAGAELMGMSARWLAAQERKASRRADQVVVVSQALADHWSDLGAQPVVIPNGCDGVLDRVPPAASAADLPRPVVGLVGHLSGRIDLDILTALSDAGFPLLLVGPHDPRWEPDRFGALVARPNVRHTGRVPGPEVASYLAAMDVGLTPYAPSSFNIASFPMKTLEYFSAGLPVVSTDLPGSRWLLDDLARADPEPDELMLLASSPAEVVSAVRRMTGPPGIVAGPASGAAGPTARGARCQAFAVRHTWADRARQLAATIGLRSVPDEAGRTGSR
jgi:teichuronic acid biosynthesis glycosyltransferase TuaH